MPARTPAPFDLESLQSALPKIFDQVQNTSANHQKNYVALYKLQNAAAAVQTPVQNGKSSMLTGEKAFHEACQDMVLRMIEVKKGAGVADRVVKFLVGYAKFITDKSAILTPPLVNEERAKVELDEDEETTTERFLSYIVKNFLPGCTAKDKSVRYRCLQCLAEILPHLSGLDEDLYAKLRSALVGRLSDKESNVRAQAAVALAKLSFSEDVSELEADETPIVEMLVDTMTYDTSVEVRRSALQSLPLSPSVLPHILTRTRDVDPSIRKAVYAHVLEKYCTVSEKAIGFTHPRILTVAQRELIVRNGLGDREPTVKSAAGQLLAHWAEIVRSTGTKEEEDIKKEVGGEETIQDLLVFLGLFDLSEGTVAEDALSSIFDTRMDIYERLQLPEDYWVNPTQQRALLGRVFVEKCRDKEGDDHSKMEAQLPLTTAMAFRVQDAYNVLVQHIQAEEALDEDEEDEEAREKREEQRTERESTIGELLRAAVNCDYGDEIGRRKMFQTVRGMLAQPVLPEPVLARALDVLREIWPKEQDLIRVVVEIVHELRDPPEDEVEPRPDGDESMTEFGSPRRPRAPQPERRVEDMSPEEKQRADEIDSRCLSLCVVMLERVNSTFEENSMLQGVLKELIVPSVKRKEMVLREKGLIALGLCCLIARNMALSSFQLFLGQVASSPEVLKYRVLQIIFDILMVHEDAFFSETSGNRDNVIQFLLQLMEKEDSDRIQALIAMGLSKLMLSGMIADERVLQTLVLVFISPETVDNQELRQCLSYFFPVYSYSSVANQRRMRDVFVPTFLRIAEVYHNWEGEDPMITPAQVSLMFADWTHPVHAKDAIGGKHREDAEKDPIQLELAADIVRELFSADMEKEDKKALCQMLGKLHLPDEIDDDKIRALKVLVSNLRTRRPPRDTTSKNALAKFDASLAKKYEKQLEDFSEDDLRKLEELKDMFEFLDDIIPLDSDEDEPPKKGRKRRSMSVATTITATTSTTSRSPSPKTKSK
ncbi:nuclear condensing complex subunit [Epithele typhae]|uniref:nuclear condensing complex subunit n=1 Tax=Epithele typhae TaxID=378194 RepID=UPI002008C159|nr:nuclear condensing complex subunit [Epithele typhae]KAH9930472.1 nuclear condensing complex subunit [Epithele typhae]